MKRTAPWLALGTVIAAGGYLAMAQDTRPRGFGGPGGPARDANNSDGRTPRERGRTPGSNDQNPPAQSPGEFGNLPSSSAGGGGYPGSDGYPGIGVAPAQGGLPGQFGTPGQGGLPTRYLPTTSVPNGLPPLNASAGPGAYDVARPTYTVYSSSNSYSIPPAGASGPGGYIQELPIVEDGKFRIIKLESAADEKVRAQANEARKQVDDALRTIRSENSDRDDLEKARKTLANYLDAQFEHDQEARRKQIESLEQQVSKLRKQMDKRSESKNKLIELRLTLLENDNSGLGFPPAWNSMGGVGQPVMTIGSFPASSYPAPSSSHTSIPVYGPSNPFPSFVPANASPGGYPGVSPLSPPNSAAPTPPAAPAPANMQLSARPSSPSGPGKRPELPESEFRKMDTNRDGGLDETELEQVTGGEITFESADINGDGKVDYDELIVARKKFLSSKN